MATNPIPQAGEFKVIKTGNRILDTIQDNVKAALKPLLLRFNAGDGIPVGTPLAWFTPTPPLKWLLCQGQLLSQTQYPALYAVIGNQYNLSTDPAGWFRLPNANGSVFLFSGQSAANGATNHTLGQTGGEETHALTTGELAVHSHTITDPTHFHDAHIGNTTGGSDNRFAQVTSSAGASNVVTRNNVDSNSGIVAASTGITGTNNAGSGTGHNTLPPYLCVNLIIKYLP